MKLIRLLLTFYRLYAAPGISISLACGYIFFSNSFTVLPLLFWFKILTTPILALYINYRQKHFYYYYKNLGVSKHQLWISTLSFDGFIFIVLLLIAYLLHP